MLGGRSGLDTSAIGLCRMAPSARLTPIASSAAAIAAISRLAFEEVDSAVIRPGDWSHLSGDGTAAGAP